MHCIIYDFIFKIKILRATQTFLVIHPWWNSLNKQVYKPSQLGRSELNLDIFH